MLTRLKYFTLPTTMSTHVLPNCVGKIRAVNDCRCFSESTGEQQELFAGSHTGGGVHGHIRHCRSRHFLLLHAGQCRVLAAPWLLILPEPCSSLLSSQWRSEDKESTWGDLIGQTQSRHSYCHPWAKGHSEPPGHCQSRPSISGPKAAMCGYEVKSNNVFAIKEIIEIACVQTKHTARTFNEKYVLV